MVDRRQFLAASAATAHRFSPAFFLAATRPAEESYTNGIKF
jgi:hypothetical protein